MASRFSLLPILSLLLLLLSLSADARPGVNFHPCNTLIFSTYSFSLSSENPNFPRRPDVVAVFTEFRPDPDVFRRRVFLPRHHERLEEFHHPQKLELPFSLGFSSLKDRTKDILNVVASLLLGAACGALTAGTLYLIWSLFNHRNESYRSMDGFSSDDDDSNGEDDIFNPKKKGYVAIPAAPASTPAVDSAPIKESA